ncbi:MAG: M48 family metallopeptidase [Candidatus Colwellbacteria bacterium]|nr:M48 family metallopeptidase [Candidatus Colwellbacteria bacterium]
MASLYTHKSVNICKTWALVSGFLVLVIGVGWIFSRVYGDPSILFIAVLFSTVMSVVSYWSSDKIVLAMHRAREINMQNNPELYRIVENLAITAGLPMPKVYAVPEEAPNAFATGRDPEHAVVAVTDGLLAKLDRSELEGVLAHELSHIGNRDTLVATMVVVLVGFVSLLSDMFTRSMFYGGRRDSRDSGGAVLVLIGLLLSVLAPISATLIQLAISRKRELLADASGALLTRYPEGLASALAKISADSTPMRTANNTTAHLWVEDQYKKAGFLHKLFMTHPPVEERIKALGGLEV